MVGNREREKSGNSTIATDRGLMIITAKKKMRESDVKQTERQAEELVATLRDLWLQET